MVIRCVMRRAWTHKFQSSGPIVYSLYCGSTLYGGRGRNMERVSNVYELISMIVVFEQVQVLS